MLCLKYHKIINRFNVRYSNKFTRTNDWASENSLIRQTLDQNRQPTTSEWRELRDKLTTMKRIDNAPHIDTMILGNCRPTQLEVGKSFINYLKEAGHEPNNTTLVNLLKLYYKASKAGAEITKDDQREIIDMYEDFRKKFPVFDSTIGEGVIFGLVLTDHWRKSLEILDSIKIISTPTSFVYSAIIQRAIQDEDEPIVWNLMNNMARECEVLHSHVFIAYIAFCEKNAEKFVENISKMLRFVEENQIVLSTWVANELQRAFQRFNYICSITSVSPQGECQSCRKRLRNVHVSDDEFNRLSSHFLDKTIFSESASQEVESFATYINRTKPYDFVIDGLNVAYSNHSTESFVRANRLVSVVKHFVDENKKILVIGRKHMETWPTVQMNYIRKNSSLFLTGNESQDDAFIIYSTLKSGPQTDFVTRDLIRDYAYKLDTNSRTIFRHWQQQHQCTIQQISPNGSVTFHEPIQFDMAAQQVDGCWHIPFENDSQCTFPKNYFELRKNWLCVARVV